MKSQSLSQLRGLLIAASAASCFACAPEQIDETIGCQSISDCELGQVCERATHGCIDEPDNRFIGAFHCTAFESLADTQNLELSEVTGRIGADRWALPSVFCRVNPKTDTLLVGIQSFTNGGAMTMSLALGDVATGHVSIGPHLNVGKNAAAMADRNSFDVFGHSRQGYVEVSGVPQSGNRLEGYVDIMMYPTVEADASFGVPCPRGLADCGDKAPDVGGAELCAVLGTHQVCSRFCADDAECALGKGVCVMGLCTRPCKTDTECAPLECADGLGCF